MLGQNVKSHCWKTYMQSLKAQNEDFSQSRLQVGVCHASTAGMMHVGIRNWRCFPVSLQTETLKIHIFNVFMSILVFPSPVIIMNKKITGSGLSQHSGNDLTLKKKTQKNEPVHHVYCPLLNSFSQKIFDTPKAIWKIILSIVILVPTAIGFELGRKRTDLAWNFSCQ